MQIVSVTLSTFYSLYASLCNTYRSKLALATVSDTFLLNSNETLEYFFIYMVELSVQTVSVTVYIQVYVIHIGAKLH